MDKIREEFEKEYGDWAVYQKASLYKTVNLSIFEAGYKSRDAEIKKHIEKYEKLLPDYNLKKAEIFLLKEEIKKLRDALKEISQIAVQYFGDIGSVGAYGVITGMAKNALKENKQNDNT